MSSADDTDNTAGQGDSNENPVRWTTFQMNGDSIGFLQDEESNCQLHFTQDFNVGHLELSVIPR